MRKMVIEYPSADVMIRRKVPVRLDGELFVVLAGSTAGQRHHAEWITSARQHVLELEGYRRETGSRDLVSRERRLDDYLLTGVSASRGTREKASGVGIEYLPRVEIQVGRATRAAGVGCLSGQVRAEITAQHGITWDCGGTAVDHITLDGALIIAEDE